MLTPEQIKEKINQYKWEKWLERDFGAFIISLFTGMEKIGNIDVLAFVFQNGSWFFSKEVYGKLAQDLLDNKKTIFEVSALCKKFYLESKREIKKLIKSGAAGKKEMEQLMSIFRENTTFIWFAHGFEEIYMKQLQIEVPKYWKGDAQLFIGDISFPKKKNAHAIFEEKILEGEDLKKIAAEFGWIKTRNGFEDPFSIEELTELREKLKNDLPKTVKAIKAPKEIKKLVESVRELVFFRTYRTDIFYELLFLSRPILKKYAENLNIPFKDLRNYRMDDLIGGIIRKYPPIVTAAQYKDSYAFFDCDIVEENKIFSQQIKGNIAFMGIAKGAVRIVKSVNDLQNVKDGDILVTNMTTPNYLIAMKRAVAFVTDEGGITCHAAIVAREMKKPCIIGTKIASKVLKDGDLVEVDANNGVVKIIK